MVGEPPGEGGGDGRLEDTTCADLLRSLAKERFSGVLELHGPRAVGRLSFVEGHPYDGEYGRLTSYAALHGLLRLKRGLYTFEPTPPPADVSPFEETLDELLEEGLHRAEHADLLRSRLPDEDERLVVDLDHPHLYRMGIDVTGIAEVFMYGATVDDAVVNSPLGEVETLQILLIMNRSGILSVGPAASTSSATTASLDGAALARAARGGEGREPSLGRGTPDATRNGASRFVALAATVLIAGGLGGALAWSSGAFDGPAPSGEAAVPVQGVGPGSAKAAGVGGAGEGDVSTPDAEGETLPSDALAAGTAEGADTGGADPEAPVDDESGTVHGEASAASAGDGSPETAAADETNPDGATTEATQAVDEQRAEPARTPSAEEPAEVATPSEDAADEAAGAGSSTGGATTEPASP